jgi:hypothetical protein
MPPGTVKHHLVLGMVPLAGFEVITEGQVNSHRGRGSQQREESRSQTTADFGCLQPQFGLALTGL